MSYRLRVCVFVVLLSLCWGIGGGFAADWPEMQGPGRSNVWDETGIMRQFPAEGLKVAWRAPIGPGYSGPAVAGGRVFVTDYQKRDAGGAERVVCLDEQTGQVLWTYENSAAVYGKFAYNSGPRAVPTVDGDRVYVQGAGGDLYCLEAATGKLVWQINFPERYKAKTPAWGFASAPLVYQNLLIAAVGGEGEARLAGFDKLTGQEVWKALSVPGEDIGYTAPIIARGGGVDQLVHFVPGEVAGLNPLTGEVYWRQEFPGSIQSVATPTVAGDRLVVSSFYKGCLMMKLAADKPGIELLWKGTGENEVKTEGLHALMCSPVMKDGHIYGVCSYGQLRCLDAATGQRLWESLEATQENARWATAHIVRNQDLYFIYNDRGELIIADLQPAGYKELSRTKLISPTAGGAGGRELGKVAWAPPAHANKHVIVRNDEEIVRFSLAQ